LTHFELNCQVGRIRTPSLANYDQSGELIGSRGVGGRWQVIAADTFWRNAATRGLWSKIDATEVDPYGVRERVDAWIPLFCPLFSAGTPPFRRNLSNFSTKSRLRASSCQHCARTRYRFLVSGLLACSAKCSHSAARYWQC